MGPEIKKSLSFLWFVCASWLILRYLLPLWFPFLLGTLVALMAEPGVRFLCRAFRFPRPLAAGIGVTAAVTGICLLLLLLFGFIFRELSSLSGILPDLEGTARYGISLLHNWMLNLAEGSPGFIRPLLQTNVEELFNDSTALLTKVSGYVLGLAGSLLSHVPDSALSTGTAILAGYMISAKLPKIQTWAETRLPMKRLKPIADALLRIRDAAGLWILSQIKLAGVTFLILMPSFFLLRISYAPFLAFLVSLVDALPVLGTGTVLLPWALICFLQQDTARAAGLLGTYIVVWATRSFLEPKLVGRQLGLDPLLTLIALYSGYKLWGLPGMLLMPLLAASAFSLLPDNGSTK